MIKVKVTDVYGVETKASVAQLPNAISLAKKILDVEGQPTWIQDSKENKNEMLIYIGKKQIGVLEVSGVE